MIKSPISDNIDNPNDNNFQVHPSSLLIKTAELMLEADYLNDKTKKIPQFGIIDIDSFSAPCIVVPYDQCQGEYKFWYLFLEPKTSWSEIFVWFLREEIEIT